MGELEVMESLKNKEEELEGLLRDAREKAAKIKEDALRKVEDIRLAKLKEIGRMVEDYKQAEIEKITKEVEIIKKEAVKNSEALRLLAEKNSDKIVAMVIDRLL
ncbi:MAG TPA: hypothetical protein DHU69_06895 [Deltaproteobacteria bacterium]|nr:MAG: hypothetical protein A2056_01920 [Deltaproteobacteria bacterium GWA2_42_85]OGP30269.1 MAG: hypothetical protein A2067_07855 [Deltaproteobacteria bacterium GWB2_42_7]OGP40325.1 MAG: hypothetical protein A2090_01310 [Deltaproteobacteria bacterium GWD2_42_10]OGP45843.1 MAG: hypothetical protein A2022_02415 [Deltaproteobacteria bacterium GWF2_42_12]OGQ28331.1 MAG: hypothetical protein A3D29_02635 [Deltaproteobacteria bacterium RIFCSPHIGHO2_02_FULL_42_44]OGQ67863.1 MAG: hypothetical protein